VVVFYFASFPSPNRSGAKIESCQVGGFLPVDLFAKKIRKYSLDELFLKD